jgi:pectinesterase
MKWLVAIISFVTITSFASDKRTGARGYDFIVAKDGSGNFTTVQEAFNAVPDKGSNRFVIFIKNGVYKEKLVLPATKENITIIGESKEGVVLTYDDYSKKVVGSDTLSTPTSYSFVIKADGFVAENITFENSAGRVGQAVAVMIEADRVTFKNCRIIGDQDTLFTRSTGRSYFVNCYIEGTTDFIFGAGIAFFSNCIMHSKKNSFVTAASTPKGNKFGYVLYRCTLTADSSLHKVFLGRPWRPYANVVYLECRLGNHITPAGWDNWRNAANEKTAFYAEYKCTGPGANTQLRVTWSHQLTAEEASKYTLRNVFAGNVPATSFAKDWLPEE